LSTGTVLAGALHRLSAPAGSTPIQRRNYEVIQLDSMAMGVIAAAATFLPVFFVRIGASAFEVSLLTTLPALGGLLFAIPFGHLIQRRGDVVDWYSVSRLIANLAYVGFAVVSALAAPELVVPLCLLVWALLTIPGTVGQVSFPVVMDGAAGPKGRYDLLGRRWAIMGLTTALSVAAVGIVLEWLPLPTNYQLVLASFSVAGLISFHYSRAIQVNDLPLRVPKGRSGMGMTAAVVRSERAFLSFVLRQCVFTAGVRLVAPLIPLYYVRTLGASDSWIGIIAMAQALALVAGYVFWRGRSRENGGRFVLLWSLGLSSVVPAIVAGSTDLVVVTALSAVGAFFTAGSDLALFDEMMKRIPPLHAVTFAGIDYALVNLAGIVAPLVAAVLAEVVGIAPALVVGASVSVAGFVMFALDRPGRVAVGSPAAQPVTLPERPVAIAVSPSVATAETSGTTDVAAADVPGVALVDPTAAAEPLAAEA
jgi:hypothetical protein